MAHRQRVPGKKANAGFQLVGAARILCQDDYREIDGSREFSSGEWGAGTD
jgi:hypothetical protein